MTSPDDPEERIRQLEQSAASYGARELGTDDPPRYADDSRYAEGVNPTTQLPPPLYGNPPYGSPPSYGSPPTYGDPYQPPFGTHYPQIQKKSSVPVGLVIGVIAVVFAGLVGIAAVVWTLSSTVDEVAGGGGAFDRPGGAPSYSPPSISFPSIPSVPSIPAIPGRETEQIATPGAPVSVAGVDGTQTVVCQDGHVSISGVNNTVTLTGHCVTVTVSGVENKVTVDSADVIGASGFDNEIVYLSGDPQINNGGSNSVTRG